MSDARGAGGGRDRGPGEPRDPDRPDEPARVEDPSEGPAPRAGPRVFDTGLQHERTALAWDRTGLSLLVVGALLLRGGGPPYHDLRHAPGYVALALGAGLLWASARRYRRRDPELRAGASPVWPRLVVVTGLGAVGVGLAALVVVLG